jgi:signal transduction histidine kinase
MAVESDTRQTIRISSPTGTETGRTWLTTLGHELRSPLGAIVGLTGMMSRKLDHGPVHREQLSRQLGLISASANELLTTVERVVELIRLDQPGDDEQPEVFDCRPVVAQVVGDLKPEAGKRGRQVSLTLADTPIPTFGSLDALRRIVTELLDNAIKYTDHPHIRVAVRTADPGYAIEVSDDGPGLSDDDMRGLGQPFGRGSAAHRGSHAGSGLGLCIAHRLATRYGADLTVSTSTAGTAFTVTFSPPPAG